jgi:hypothetical protein
VTSFCSFRNDLGFLYLLDWNVDANEMEKLELIPSKIEGLQATPKVNAEEREWLADTIQRLSEPFKTNIIEQENGHLVITP